MTAPDLEPVLREVSALARRASDCALHSPNFPASEAAAIIQQLTGVQLDWRRNDIGAEQAGAAHFAKAIVVLSSMLAARHGLAIGMAGVLDDLRPPARPIALRGWDPAQRVCLNCLRPFRSEWRGNRICDACAPRVMPASLSEEGVTGDSGRENDR